jgi:alpha-L-rhamnosidase
MKNKINFLRGQGLWSSLAAAWLIMTATACGNPATVAGERTDALDDAAWEHATWISAADAAVVTGPVYDGARAASGASWFVAPLENTKKVTKAVWMTTGLGVYDLYVNGKLIGTEVLKPGFTHYAKTRRSFTYDVTDVLRTKAGAQNIFAAQVTPGWWADKIITPAGHDGMIGKKCAFRGVVQLTFADGTTQLFGTDTEHWLAGIAGPVKHAAIFDGEDYDARELPGYACMDKLSTPEVNTEFAGEILPSAGAEIYLREDLALPPVKAYTWKDVEGATDDAFGKVVVETEYAPGAVMTVKPGETLVIDFGQNASAVPSFVFKAAEGTVLTCLPAELLNDGNGAKSRGMDGPEGSCHRTNLRIPETGMILNYTFAAAKEFVSYTPRCTFFGYRFVSITATDEVVIKSIASIPVTSIAKCLETGILTTGCDDVNRLISNTVWGQRSNYLSVPTDCPQRNERLGWTADTQVFTATGTFFANTSTFFHKWMRDMIDSQSPLGGFPGVAPLAQYGWDMMRLGWADAGIIVPWTIWKQFADTQIVDECWEAMEKYMNWVDVTQYNHQSHVAENGNYQWADWLSYEPLESSSGRSHYRDANGAWVPRPETIDYWNFLSASYWAYDAGLMADMAAATGRDADKYRAMQQRAVAFIRETFLNEDGTFKTEILNTMQAPALFALKNNVVEGAAKEATIARLKANFAEHDNCLQTGFLATSILMQTLTDNGMSDIAWNLLFQRKNPSWLYSVDNGATTIWERWNSYTLESGMGPAGMNSFNHYAYGSVCQWLWETAAGISANVAQPGFSHIVMKPLPDKRLGSLKAEYKSAAGVITSEWKYEGDKWLWDFTVPEGATATVTLPGETESKEYTAGTYHIER